MNTALKDLDKNLTERKVKAHEGYNKTYSSLEKTLCFLRSKWSWLTPIILIVALSVASYMRTLWEHKKTQRLREAAAATRLVRQQERVEAQNLEKKIRGGEVHIIKKGQSFGVVWRDILGISAVPVRARLNEKGDFKLYEPGSVEKPGPLNSLDNDVEIVELQPIDHDIEVYYKPGKGPRHKQ